MGVVEEPTQVLTPTPTASALEALCPSAFRAASPPPMLMPTRVPMPVAVEAVAMLALGLRPTLERLDTVLEKAAMEVEVVPPVLMPMLKPMLLQTPLAEGITKMAVAAMVDVVETVEAVEAHPQ